MFSSVLLSLLMAGAAFGLLFTAGLCLCLWRTRATPAVAVAGGLAVLGVAGWLNFWAWLASPLLGRVVGTLFLVSAAAAVVAAVRRSPEVRRSLLAMAPGGLVAAGLALVTGGLIYLWGVDREVFAFGTRRFTHPLPVDGEIPQLIVDRLLAGQDPSDAVAGWQSSDRPTLQSGLLLLVEQYTQVLGIHRSPAGLSAGVVAQLAWLPAAAALLRALGARRRGVLAGMVVTAMTGTVLVNTVFTWPKLLSAGFVMAALAVVVETVRTDGRFTLRRTGLVGLLIALGMLAHSAALFAAPIVVLALLAHRRRGLTLRTAGAGVAVAGLTYLPWILYQRFYDPGGTRILVWHLAEVHEPQHGNVLRYVLDAYGNAGVGTTLDNKWANLVRPFSAPPWAGITPDGLDLHVRRSLEFFTYSGAIGVGWLGVVLVLGSIALAFVRRRPRDPFAVRVALVLAFSLISLVLWALVLFGPATTHVHHGSHVPIVIALAAPLAWTVDRHPVVGTVIGAFGLWLCLKVYIPYFGSITPVSAPALVVTAVGVVCVLAGFLVPTGRTAARLPRHERAAEGRPVARAGAAVPEPRRELQDTPAR